MIPTTHATTHHLLQLGEHAAALRILALQLGDLEAAARYCRQHAGQEGYAALMDMLLAPGVGEAPRLEQACQLLTARGAWAALWWWWCAALIACVGGTPCVCALACVHVY